MTSAEIEKARWRLAERKKAALGKVREAAAKAKTWSEAIAMTSSSTARLRCIIPEGEAREKAVSAALRARENLAKAKHALREVKAAYEALIVADVGVGSQRMAAYRRAVAELEKAAA